MFRNQATGQSLKNARTLFTSLHTRTPLSRGPPQMENYGRPYSDYGIMILAAENPSAEKTPSLLAVWGSLVGVVTLLRISARPLTLEHLVK